MTEQPVTPVRVAVVIPRYAPIFGGAENQCRQLNRALRRRGDVTIPFVVTKRLTPDLPPREEVDGTPVHRIGRPGLSRWSEYGFYLRAIAFLWRRRREFDVVHCHATSLIGFAITVLSRLARRPAILKLSSNGELVTGLHNFSGTLQLDGGLMSRLRRPLARYAARHARIVALNGEGMDELRLAGARRPCLVPNGVDTERFHPPAPEARLDLRAQHGFEPDDFVFVYTGRFVATKGIDTLLAAVDALGDRARRARMRFCFVGSGELQDRAVSISGTVGTVRVFPPTPDVRRYLAMSDAFVFPSRREGMPNAVLEAMAMGLPCVLSDIRPHRELAGANPGVRSFLFASGDAAALAAALLACRQAALEAPPAPGTLDPQFRLDSVARRYAALYREMLAPSRAGAAIVGSRA